MLLTTKYLPDDLKTTLIHKNIYLQIDRITNVNNIPNLIFYGIPLSGKSTLIQTLLNKLYGKKKK